LILALLLFVGAAISNSTHHFAWTPLREFVFRYESKVDFRIPEIRADQKSGLRLTSVIRIQTTQDYSLLIKLDTPRFMIINGLGFEQEEPIPQIFKTHLMTPFKVHLRRGIVEAVFVDREEPVAVTNIKKAVLANLNMDLSATRRGEILSNHLEVLDEQTLEQSPLDQSYFTVREQSLHGDCETTYNVHPLPDYEALEIEYQFEKDEQKRNEQEHLQGGLSQAKAVCSGKKYWQITKTRNFDNCLERPVFQKWAGFKSMCDTSKASCINLLTHMSSTNYIVCGNDIRDFVIRKSITENAMASGIGWTTDEKFFNHARVVLELLRVEPITTPLTPVPHCREIKNLIFEYPAGSITAHQSLNEQLSPQEKEKIEQESGIRPMLPKPDLHSGESPLYAIKIEKDEIARQVIDQLKTVAKEVFESPESATAKEDIAGVLTVVVKALRTLSLNDLKYVESRLESQINAYPLEHKAVIRSLFYDVVSMIGTNPAVMLVKERLRDTSKVDRFMAVRMIQSTLSNVRTPTQELLHELVNFVKNDLKRLSEDRTQVYNMAMVHLTKLIHKACICPLKTNTFPEKIYGPFCVKDSPIVAEWSMFLERELETQQNRHIKLNIITAIGKLGNVRAVQALAKIISNPNYNEMVRSLAVYSLKKAARLEPIHVRPVLLAIIDNPAEVPEVRIAAVAVLPYAQPNRAMLQKIAVRTWLEPSQEVASFIYSTLKSLTVTKIPELVLVGQEVKTLIHLAKPVVLGLHYAKYFNFSYFVKYLDIVLANEFSWTKSKQGIVPVRHSWNNKLMGAAYQLNGPGWTVYTHGMDKFVDMILTYTKQMPFPSPYVKEQLAKITGELNVEERRFQTPAEMLMQVKMGDFENDFFLNEARIVDVLQQISETLRKDAQSLSGKLPFQFIRAFKFLDAVGYGPSDAGFPLIAERSAPIVMAVKGHAQLEVEERNSVKIPTMAKVQVAPVINMKVQGNMGVISPFTNELIGAGVEMGAHYATPLEMTMAQKANRVILDVKVPETVQRELEAVHIFVRPYIGKMDLRKIQPFAKSTDVKILLSGAPLKQVNLDIGKPLEVDAKLIAESDAKYTDLYSYWEKIRQHNGVVSLLESFWLPSTFRMSSAKIVFDPRTSLTKEFSLSLGFVKLAKDSHMVKKSTFPHSAPVDPIIESLSKKTMGELANDGTVLAMLIGADLKSLSGPIKGVHTALSLGFKKESQSLIADTYKMVSNIELHATSLPMYEINFASRVEIPRILNRWNKDLMVEEALKLVFRSQIDFGFQTAPKKTVRLSSQMVKTEMQKQSVKMSPEFQRCSHEEQQGKHLAPVCEMSRHQAVSIDEISAELELPIDVTKSPVLNQVAILLKSYFIGQIWTEESTYVSTNAMRFLVRVSRAGEEAQLVAEVAGQKYKIVNIRLPQVLKGILPISMRNPLRYNLIQKISNNQLPASCRVEPNYISTFDSKTYAYKLNDCYHLVFKDCSQKIPVAVLAKTVVPATQEKIVKVLAGPVEVIMTPLPHQVMQFQLNIDGIQKVIKLQPGQTEDIAMVRAGHMETVMEIKAFKDNVYLVNAFKEGLWVLFDGVRVEVSGSYLLRARACGLCGDLNGEKTADLKTPRQCIMSRPRFAAYSYMIPETCAGIPTTDKAIYEKERAMCIKEEIIPTPLERLTKIVATKTFELTKPMIKQHLVQRQPKSGQVCISIQKVKVCSKISQEETVLPRPVKVAPIKVEYVCFKAASPKAQQLEQLAKAGESLDMEVSGKAMAFSKIVYEPIVCQRQSNKIGI